MNIGIFTDTYFPQISGVASSIATLEKELSARGHRVYIFTSTDKAADPEQEEGKVFRFSSLAVGFVPERRLAYAGIRRATKLMKELNIEIVHTHTEFTMGCLGKHLAHKCKLPHIHTYHTMYEDYVHYIARGKLLSPKMVGRLTKWFCRGADAVIAPTEKVKTYLRRYKVSEPIYVIPTGVSVKQFKRSEASLVDVLALRKKLGINESDKVIISIGRMAEEKNMEALLYAIKSLESELDHVKTVMVGDGPVRKSLEALAVSLGVSEHVRFTGAVEWNQIHHYYHLGDLFVSASTTEAQGLTYIEAMASGCIVVAKSDPSIKRIVLDGTTGFVFKEDEDLGPLLRRLLHSSHLTKVRKAAKKQIQPLTAEAFGAKVEQTYFELAKNKKIENSSPKLMQAILYRKEQSL
ncbi:glycosyltransferase [Niallia circulans]|jgi:1,2-diacylglycerol 3-alpha-glucosyltransferase|uniref:glycosyltransferase family 4 protein n=1 Tax=Shouchella clausii TaxID=79880 RepID=UPI000B96EF81|nr:glycosyltransferase family 4 protein [Shouchella clausii]PAD42935.1 1,2-diacylglycerol 3-glucosyltransferase [Bacillus sp. 7520-S]SPU21709.1 glycosyltransferase [Niallia circulans]AST97923.1 1,2-diacylglycerol 3-glucosyltransferase [Shouchella clausii]MCR1289276.1 glycosyltransferase family 4 protein [Shouchella clausii]MEB5475374.1 glycosyltransferase family 4 protein [Shouchella clausii]